MEAGNTAHTRDLHGLRQAPTGGGHQNPSRWPATGIKGWIYTGVTPSLFNALASHHCRLQPCGQQQKPATTLCKACARPDAIPSGRGPLPPRFDFDSRPGSQIRRNPGSFFQGTWPAMPSSAIYCYCCSSRARSLVLKGTQPHLPWGRSVVSCRV